MPGLPQRTQFSNASYSTTTTTTCSTGSISVNGIWSKHRDHVSFDQLQKFWSGLPEHARQALLRIDKQTLLEQARKNLYCSRCNGLLLEGFSQIIMYGKSLQHEGGTVGHICTGRMGVPKNQNDNGLNLKSLSCQDECQDPSVHPWGGLVATRDGILTLLDCFLETKSLKALQNVFDSARVRERERELLYPDACGGGGRGWISQGVANYGRGHGTRETCALHTARLSCDTLVDFWSALGDETRRSLLRMKEEDFIERLMYRFDSKRFCRDCRRNVIREFKELKELKRMRREPRCTSWFCVADTAFQYEVSDDMVQADWHQSFSDTVGTYHHFEWAIGTAEGKSDILEFEDVGMNGSVQVDGLDLGDLCACYITLRAWRLDGRCTELSVKAHAMKGQPCVHRRVVVGDGYVTITKGESIRRFFEHAEEAEEEEDDDSMDKDGNELDGTGSRPQKHAKSPELAREFLLDAATVIFKEQVEKAFREGTARQNAHSIFVCLALKLLEERVHVACKEIITLEKQTKLLEEEEKEKREEEERRERRRIKEREKKLRRKERLKGKEREKEKISELKENAMLLDMSKEELSLSSHEASNNTTSSEDSISETGENVLGRPLSPDIQEEQSSNGHVNLEMQGLEDDGLEHPCNVADEVSTRDGSDSFVTEQSKAFRRKLRFKKEYPLDPPSKWCDRRRSADDNEIGAIDESEPRFHGGYKANPSRCINGVNRQLRNNPLKSNVRSSVPKFNEKFSCSNNRMRDRCDFHSCSCSQHNEYQAKDGRNVSTIRTGREIKMVYKLESVSDVSRQFYRGNKYNGGYYATDGCGIPKNKFVAGNFSTSRDLPHTKKVWEPTDSRKKYPRSNSDSDVTLKSSSFKGDQGEEGRSNGDEIECQHADNIVKSSGEPLLCEHEGNSLQVNSSNNGHGIEDDTRKESRKSCLGTDDFQNGFDSRANTPFDSKDAAGDDVRPCPIISSTSSSDNCSSCLSEGDSSTASSGTQNAESWSTSDSEDASQQSEGRETSTCGDNGYQKFPLDGVDETRKTAGVESFSRTKPAGSPVASCVGEAHSQGDPSIKNSHNPDNGRIPVDMAHQHRLIPPIYNQGIHLPVIPAPSTMAYYHQSPASWTTTPVNGLMQFPQPNRYLFTSPIGYGLSTNQPSHLCMQYSPLQPVPNSILNVGQHPAYQPVTRATVVNSSKGQPENPKLAASQQPVNAAGAVVRECPVDRPVLNGQTPSQASSHRENGQPRPSSRMHSDATDFSLFHFGGPIAAAAGCGLNPASCKEKAVGDFSSNLPANSTQADLTSAKKETTVEQYSLFASSNATRFSFF